MVEFHVTDAMLALHCSENGIADPTEALHVAEHLIACDECLLRLIQFYSMRATIQPSSPQQRREVYKSKALPAPTPVGGHISDSDLERYYLGMVRKPELKVLEEHLLVCARCAVRAEDTQNFVDGMRAAIIAGDFDLEWLKRNSGKKRK